MAWQRGKPNLVGTPVTKLRGRVYKDQSSQRGDSYDTAFAPRALTRISKMIAERGRPPLPLVQLITQDNSGGAALAYHGYNEANVASKWKKRAPGAKDAPRTTADTKEVIQKVELYWNSADWTHEELVRAAATDTPLKSLKLVGMRDSYEEMVQDGYIYGDPNGPRLGLLNDVRIQGVPRPSPLTKSSTADQLYKALIGAAHSVRVNSKSTYRANAILVPDILDAQISTTLFDGTNQDDTVKARVENHARVKIIPVPEFDDLDTTRAAAEYKTVMIAGHFSDTTLQAIIPMPYTELPPHIDQVGDVYQYVKANIGGLEIYHPEAFYLVGNAWEGGLDLS